MGPECLQDRPVWSVCLAQPVLGLHLKDPGCGAPTDTAGLTHLFIHLLIHSPHKYVLRACTEPSTSKYWVIFMNKAKASAFRTDIMAEETNNK